jgi:hypothetical protein
MQNKTFTCRWWSSGLWRNVSPSSVYGGNTFLRNVGIHIQDHTASQPIRPQSTASLPWEPQISDIILPVVLYECEIWPYTLMEDNSLRIFSNKVPTIIFGPTQEKVSGGWRKLQNKGLHNSHFSSNIITVIKSRRMKRSGHVNREDKYIQNCCWNSSKEEITRETLSADEG